ncbi:hypothetical protein Hanom_Chr02g00143061 [Helianthus anomalus]
MSVAPGSPARVPTPPHDPEPVPEADPPIPDHDHVPFGLLDIAPHVPEPIPAPIDLPLVEPFIPPPPPADVAPLPPVESDVHRIDLPIIFLQDIPAPRPGEGTSGQPPSYDPFALATFPLISHTAPFTPFTSTPLDGPFRWFPPYTMPISDPYHPSHFFEILIHRVLELELTPSYPPCPGQSTFVPPHSLPPATFVPPPAALVPPYSSSFPFAHPPTAPTPFPSFDARFLTVEQQIGYLCHTPKIPHARTPLGV